MADSPFIATVTYWNDAKEPWEKKTTSVLIYAENFTDAAKRAEKYFDNIEDMHIFGLAEEGTLCELTPEMVEYFKSGKGIGWDD